MTIPTKNPFKAAISSAFSTVTSANYTVTDTDGFDTLLFSTGGSNRTLTLPAVATNAGRRLLIKKIDSGVGTVLIDTPGAETIDGAAQNTLTAQYAMVTLVSDGSNWSVVSVWDYKFVNSGGGVTNIKDTTAASQSISLSAGRWRLDGRLIADMTTVSNPSNVDILTAFDTTSAAISDPNICQYLAHVTTTVGMRIPVFAIVNLTSTTTVYLNASVSIRTGTISTITSRGECSIEALRVK
jgi:hypothetical protein